MKTKVTGGLATMAALFAIWVAAGGTPGGGTPTPTPTATATTTATPTSTATPVPGVANLWVNTTAGASPGPRCSTACDYNATDAYGSFAAACAAASANDVVRIKAGTHSRQGSIGCGKAIHYIGEPGAKISSGAGSGAYDTLSLNGKVHLTTVSVTGDMPIVQIYGDGNQWDGTAANPARLDGLATRSCTADEPLLIQDGDANGTYTITNNIIGPYVEIGTFTGYVGASLPACSDGVFHLEQSRVGKGVNGLLFDRVTFEDCPACGSGNLFITNCCTGGNSAAPVNITVKNSKFFDGNYHVQTGGAMTHNANWTFAYTYFSGAAEPFTSDGSPTNIKWIGNVWSRPGTAFPGCMAGHTYTKNVGQWNSGSACGTDLLVSGPRNSISNLGVDADGVPQPGSPAINGGPAGPCSDADGIDFTGATRPIGSACDAGAYEVG